MTTEQKIYNTAARDGMPVILASLLVGQSKHETGNYQHRFFTVGNNAFGYSYDPKSKWQLDKGGPKADNGVQIAQYASVENSVHEITDWIRRRQGEGKFPQDLKTIDDPDEYSHLLKAAGYYQDSESNYAADLARYFYSSVQNFKATAVKNPLLIIGAVLLITGSVFLLIKYKKAVA